MRHRETGLPHGIVRFVNEDGLIAEGSHKHGTRHGLQMLYWHASKVYVSLYKEGSCQARFDFDSNFKEINRGNNKR